MGIILNFSSGFAVTLDELLELLPSSKFAKEVADLKEQLQLAKDALELRQTSYDQLALAINENTKLREQVAEMRAALQPFAETGQEMLDFAEKIKNNHPDAVGYKIARDDYAIPDLPKLTFAAFKKAAEVIKERR